jgi:hypothetical protein
VGVLLKREKTVHIFVNLPPGGQIEVKERVVNEAMKMLGGETHTQHECCVYGCIGKI